MKIFVELPCRVFYPGRIDTVPLLIALNAIAEITTYLDNESYTTLFSVDGKEYTITKPYKDVVNEIQKAQKRGADDAEIH